MAPESLLIAGLLLAAVALLLVLVFRRPAPDPALVQRLADQQAVLDRQAERIAALPAEFERSLAREAAAIGDRVGAGALDQTRALGEGIGRIADRLSAQEKAMLDRLAADAAALGERLAQDALAMGEQRAAVAKALAEHKDDTALLRRDVTAAVTDGLAKIQAALTAETALAREAMSALEKAVLDRLASDAKATQEGMTAETARSRDILDRKLTEMREMSEKRLAEIQKSVNEQLAGAVEKQMTESFQRVIDQFNAIQAMMGNVQSVATQVGDLKRLFSNVKTRGGWGEAQVKAVLDDILPEGSYQTNVKLHEGSNDLVEFAIRMPVTGDVAVFLPVDAKFPVEDYERILAAHDAGDAEGEAAARRALAARIRGEAAKIRSKYVHPPQTTEFAVMYLPTEGLYAELARMPGVIDEVGRECRVFIAGPSLLPAMLRTIQLGHVTLALSKNAESVRELLAATKAEMGKMDTVLDKLGKQVGTVTNTIGDARKRTKIIAKRLTSVEAMPGEEAAGLLGLDSEVLEDEEAP